jgi:hypothetical protein
LIQNYKYVLENNRTSGEYLGDKINYYYISTSPYGTFGNSCSRLVITNSGNANLTSINGKPVAYKRVITEVENTSGTENYKTIDYFTNYPSSNFTFAGQPFFLYANNQYARGILNKKSFIILQIILLKNRSLIMSLIINLMNNQPTIYIHLSLLSSLMC